METNAAIENAARRLAELEAQVRLLQDERDIVATLTQYANALDYGRESALVDAFTPDGIWELKQRAIPTDKAHGVVTQGHVELLAAAKAHTRAPGKYHKHIVIEPVITIDGDQATASSYMARLDETEEFSPFLYAFGRYLDTLRRCDDGRWRISRRIVEIESMASRMPDDMRTAGG